MPLTPDFQDFSIWQILLGTVLGGFLLGSWLLAFQLLCHLLTRANRQFRALLDEKFPD